VVAADNSSRRRWRRLRVVHAEAPPTGWLGRGSRESSSQGPDLAAEMAVCGRGPSLPDDECEPLAGDRFSGRHRIQSTAKPVQTAHALARSPGEAQGLGHRDAARCFPNAMVAQQYYAQRHRA